MRSAVGWAVVVVLVIHGLLHLLGVAKGFGWAEVAQLKQPIGTTGAWVWLAAGSLVLVTASLLGADVGWWWVVGACALVVSQVAILSAWSDAKAGTVANVVLLLAVGYGFASQGPTSFRAEYRSRVDSALTTAALASAADSGPVTETDLDSLPEPVATYVRRVGAIGKSPVRSMRAVIHGRIRAGADEPWMSFVGEQVNTYGADADWSRTFFLDATKSGLPVDVLHTYAGTDARMRVRLASLVPITDERGPDLTRAETVTLFNDLAVLAPAALVGAPIRWESVDDRHARGAFTHGGVTVTADLVFDAEGDLVDFVSQDRLRSVDGGLVVQPWSTPVTDYGTFAGRRAATRGEGRWQAPEPEGDFAYLDFRVDELVYNEG